jgi:hypothetical protein
MTRSLTDWDYDADNTTKSVTQLGNELRDRWGDWRHESPHKTWDEHLQAHLGITAQALRDRNKRARKKSTIAPATVNETPQPARQHHATPEELSRRRALAASLWQEGWPRGPIAEALGVNEGTTQRDLLAAGCEGKRPLPKPPGRPEGDFGWRKEDVEGDGEESTIQQASFAACKTPSATEAIEDVRIQLALILGSRYRLSLKDRNHLITVLNNALERLHNGNQETQDSPNRARVAG